MTQLENSSVSNQRLILTDLTVVGVAVVWGSSYVAMQEVGKYLEVQPFLAVRFLVALPILVYLFNSQLKKINRKEVGVGLFLGVLLFFILSLETTGVKYTSAANAGFIIAVSVVLVPLFERIIGGVRKKLSVYIFSFIALFGCFLLSRPTSSGLGFMLGYYIILGAAFIRGLQIFYFGHFTKKSNVSTTNITLVELSLVAFLACTWSFVFSDLEDFGVTSIPFHIWLIVLYLGIIGTSFAFLAQINAAQKTSSTRVALILSSEPVFAAFFAWAIANETLSLIQLLGGLLIFVAAFFGRMKEV